MEELHHIDERTLEAYVAASTELDEPTKTGIEANVGECALCREQVESLRLFYRELDESLDKGPTERDRSFMEKIFARRRFLLPSRAKELREKADSLVEAYAEIIEPYRRPLMQRLWRYVQIHPVRSAAAASFGIAVLAAMFLVSRPVARDTNPAYAKIKDYVLTVYNKEAEVLWTKSVLGIPDRSSEIQGMTGSEPRFLQMGDLDGDGVNEILISGANREGVFTVDSLYCYEHDGHLRWAMNSGKIISFGDTTVQQHSIAAIWDIFVMKKTTASHPQLFLVASEVSFSPTKLAELDPKTGHEIQAYYNRGGSGRLLSYDLDGDGSEELLLVGINDAFNRAYLSVLDPSDINGHAPVPPQYEPHNVPEAREKYYLLFPLTYFGIHYSVDPYNQPMNIWITQGRRIDYEVSERLQKFPINNMEAQVVYTIDSTMRVESVAPGNGLIKAQEYLLQNGTLKKPLLPEYLSELKDSVLYWDGERFGNKPTTNLRYRQPQQPTP